MDEVEVEVVESVDLTDPVLIEGLPGVGHVGSLTAEHLIEEFDGTLTRRVHSEHLPPQVSVDESGTASLIACSFTAIETDGRDLLVLTGDHQAQTPMGHYRLAHHFLEVADDLDVSSCFTLGGVPTGEFIEEYEVIGAVSDGPDTESLKDDLQDAGVSFREGEPAGGIIGISGLLVGLAPRYDLPAACLMGETSGYLVDPKSARAVLEILEAHLELTIDYEALDDRAEEMESVVQEIQAMETESAMDLPMDEDLRYIG